MEKRDNFSAPSFSLRNRVSRVIWWFVNILFFKFSPRPFFGWRVFLLRCFGAKIGRRVRVYPGTRIWAPWNLEIGDESAVAEAIVYSQGKIRIGRRTVVSQGSHLVAGTHDYTKADFTLITKPIEIGNHVWIAADAFLHPGVKIGDGSVIGARSVVTRDMPPWMVCAGHPCRPLKPREFEGMEHLVKETPSPLAISLDHHLNKARKNTGS